MTFLGMEIAPRYFLTVGTLDLMLVIHQLASLTPKTISATAALCFRVHDHSDKK